jgi:RNA polymerase sigma factor (sigma-70 family)
MRMRKPRMSRRRRCYGYGGLRRHSKSEQAVCVPGCGVWSPTSASIEVPPSQLQALCDVDLSARVDAALNALPERQRLALTLFHYEGLSQVEVGDVLGVSEEAVESLLARARRALKVSLQERWRQLLSK